MKTAALISAQLHRNPQLMSEHVAGMHHDSRRALRRARRRRRP